MAGGGAEAVVVKDVRRPQAVDGDCLRSTLNPDGIGLIAPVEDPVWADIRGLEGSRKAPCRRKTCEMVARSLKIKADGAACRNAGSGPKLSNVDPQLGHEVGDVGACGG